MDFTDSGALGNERERHHEDNETELLVAHLAAANGEIDTLTQAIKADPTVLEYQDTDGLTPLAHAVMAEQLDSVKLLVKMGAAINAQDNLGRTYLSVAAYQGWYEGVVFLLRSAAKQNICDKSGRSPLHSATYHTDSRVVSALLQNLTTDEINLQDNEGMTPLHWAAFHNRPSHIEILLARGADSFSQDIDGKTALHWAAQIGSVPCCQLLLAVDGGPLLNAHSDYSGKTPCHFAAAAGHGDVIIQLYNVPGCDLEAEDPDERTPLHWAAATGQADAVNTLLELRVHPNPIDAEGGTPLDYAGHSGHQECVKILERRLGPRMSRDKTPSGGRESDLAKSRKNPLGFIMEFFKSRKPIKHDCLENIADNQECVVVTSDHSDGSCQILTNNNEQNQNYVTLNFTLSSESKSVPNDNCGLSAASLSPSHCASQKSSIHGSPQMNLGSLPGTPKRQKESEVIRSIEKLYLSREDNPALIKHKKVDNYLGEISQSHSTNIPMRGSGKAVLPPTVTQEETGSPDHSHLIRSPPPVLKRDRSLSPVISPVSLRAETNLVRLEQDAAQILALHRERIHSPPSPCSSRSLSPLTRCPSAQPCHEVTQGDSCKDEDVYFWTHQSQPLLQPGPTEGSDVSSPHHGNKGHQVQLAPLRGQVPLKLPAPNQPLVNRRLEHLKLERSGANRSPSPPNWPCPRQDSSFPAAESMSPYSSPASKARMSTPNPHHSSLSNPCSASGRMPTSPKLQHYRSDYTSESIENISYERADHLDMDKAVHHLLH